MLRTYLFEAAAPLLVRLAEGFSVEDLGPGAGQAAGFKHAAVALARKHAVLLHAM